MVLTNKQYDFIKNWLLPILMGGATFVITLGKLWEIPYYNQIAGTMTAVATFISFVINESSRAYFEDKDIIPATVDKNGQG